MEVKQFCTAGSQTCSEGLGAMFSCLPARVGQILGDTASGPMSCACSVICAAEEPPHFLMVVLKVLFAALSVQICQCHRNTAGCTASSNQAALGTLSCKKPGLT